MVLADGVGGQPLFVGQPLVIALDQRRGQVRQPHPAQGRADVVADDAVVAVDGGGRADGLDLPLHPQLQPARQRDAGMGGRGGPGQGEAQRWGGRDGAQGEASGAGMGVGI